MSAFIGVFGRKGHSPDRKTVDRMLETLRHRGPDGHAVSLPSGTALGHQHFWTTPEEQGEKQPLSRGNLHLVFDGRLDNREELLEMLALPPGVHSDAMLVLQAYAKWGDGCFEKLLGPFALVIHDSLEKRVIAARDPVGERTLFYSLTPAAFSLASEPRTLLEHPEVSPEVNEAMLALYFALRFPADGSTFFSSVRELLPGHVLTWSEDSLIMRQYHSWKPGQLFFVRDELEVFEQFRSLMAAAVRCRLRTLGEAATLLSGGLDSPTVTAFTVTEKQKLGLPRHKTVSWIFDTFSECDERRWIQPAVEKFGTEATFIKGDDCWTFCNFETWPLNPNTPLSNGFRRLKDRAWAAARDSGCRVILAGTFSDQLFSGSADWLADLLTDGHLREFAAGLTSLQLFKTRTWPWKDPSARRVAARLFPFLRKLRKPFIVRPRWLTDRAWDLAQSIPHEATVPSGIRRSEQFQSALGPLSWINPVETYFASHAGVEIREPFADRRLVEFMLGVPSYVLRRGPLNKYLIRRAMRGILPDCVTGRLQPTPLSPLYYEGVLKRERLNVIRTLNGKRSTWRSFVKEDWLMETFAPGASPTPDEMREVVLSFAVAAELWLAARGVR